MSSSVSVYILEMVALRLFYNLATEVPYLSGESELTHEKLNPEQIYCVEFTLSQWNPQDLEKASYSGKVKFVLTCCLKALVFV